MNSNLRKQWATAKTITAFVSAVLLASVCSVAAGEQQALVGNLQAGTGPMLNAQMAASLRGDMVTVTVDQGRYAIQAQGEAAPFASGALRYQGAVKVGPVKDGVFGEGRELTIAAAAGAGESFQVFPGLPFVFHRCILVNTGAVATVVNKVPLMDAVLELGKPADQLVALGTGGLKPLAQNAGSYAWMAVADPASRAGVVGGWLTHERGSGVVFTRIDGGRLNLEARLSMAACGLNRAKSVVSETFILVGLPMRDWVSKAGRRGGQAPGHQAAAHADRFTAPGMTTSMVAPVTPRPSPN